MVNLVQRRQKTNWRQLDNWCDRTVLGLIQEQCLEYVVVEGGVVEAGPGTVWAEVHLKYLRLYDSLT